MSLDLAPLRSRLNLLLTVLIVLLLPCVPALAGTCDISYNLPGDIGDFGNDPPDQANLDTYSWQTFLALNAPAVGQSVSTTGDNRTLWGGSVATPITSTDPGWSSTDDLLLAATATSTPDYGVHYYPTVCQQVDGYQSYRVIDEISKVDDSFFEATKQGLSADPVVATNGTFLRYEILISEVTYDTIVDNKWYLSSVLDSQKESLSFPCGTYEAGGSKASPSDTGIGAITIKNAWMEADGLDSSKYHMEKILIYTPASQNASGQDTCQLETMALVGQHIAHKTTQQGAWTWSTFEHASNAPDCTTTPPPAPPKKNDPSTGCPSTGGTYNFFPSNTSDARFASCNSPPATNNATKCDDNYCADEAPNSQGGYSRLCRQLALEANYPTAYSQTQACNQATGSSSVWSNYVLISTQWFTAFTSDQKTNCQNEATTVSPNGKTIADYAPQVTLTASGSSPQTVPYLANSSMESYERSNCMGCHTNALVNKNSNISTDLMYFMMLEVPAAPVNQTTNATEAKTKASAE